jgi:hypothetical protein
MDIKVDEQITIDYKVIRTRMLNIIDYLDSNRFKTDSVKLSSEIINDKLYIYNHLRKRFIKNHDFDDIDQYKDEYQEMYFNLTSKLYQLYKQHYNIKTQFFLTRSIYY